jgi:hypothetical protein
MRIYVPIAAIVTVGMMAGIYGFINVEETALTTIPPQQNAPEIFVPQTPTPAPGGFLPSPDGILGTNFFDSEL